MYRVCSVHVLEKQMVLDWIFIYIDGHLDYRNLERLLTSWLNLVKLRICRGLAKCPWWCARIP